MYRPKSIRIPSHALENQSGRQPRGRSEEPGDTRARAKLEKEMVFSLGYSVRRSAAIEQVEQTRERDLQLSRHESSPASGLSSPCLLSRPGRNH